MNRGKIISALLLAFRMLIPFEGSSQSANAERKWESDAVIAGGNHRGNLRMGLIEDLSTCRHWSLERVAHHPDWPARLVEVSDEALCLYRTDAPQGKPTRQNTLMNHRRVIVREGDVLAISEETTALRANLEGVALSSGPEGGVIRVRLRFAGKVMSARITAPGMANLIRSGNEVRQ